MRFFSRIEQHKAGREAVTWMRRVKYTSLAFLRSFGLFPDDNYEKLLSYRNRHVGGRCFLIGNGPSLKAADLDLLKGEICFGCNLIYKIFDQTDWRPTYLAVTDLLMMEKLSPGFGKDFSIPLFTNKAVYREMREFPPEVIWVQSLPPRRYRVRNNMLAYYYDPGATVMAFMLELAMFMGFCEIYLLGVDCTSSVRNSGHFAADYMNDEDIRRLRARVGSALNREGLTEEEAGNYYFDRSVNAYAVIGAFAEKHHIIIFNCTRGGALEVFERKPLEDILKTQ